MASNTYKSFALDLAVDTITEDDLGEFVAWLKDYPRLTMADKTREFEEAWSKWMGVKYSVMVNSGSSADLMMYAALDAAKRSGSRKVVVPATGWATTIAPAIQFGWTPIMCESDAETFGMDPECLEEILKTENPDTVIVVHVLGVPCKLDEILKLQEKYGFALLEDCCASHGARHNDALVGSFGAMSAFSFYYGHHMSTVEGGVICTDDDELYHSLLMLRSHGWIKDLPADKAQKIMDEHQIDPFHSPFTFVVPGFNLRPTDMNAQLGLIQLKSLDATVERRAQNHLVYQELLEGSLEFAQCVEGDKVSSISFCAVAESVEARKKIVEVLEKENIDTRLFTAANIGKHPFWKDRFSEFSAPVADKLYDGGFFLPNNQTLDRADIEGICSVVRDAVG